MNLAKVKSTLGRYYRCITKSSNYEYKVPVEKRFKLMKNGFVTNRWITYNLSVNNINDYISDVENSRAGSLSGPYGVIMDNKLIFAEIFKKYVPVPKTFAWINEGKFYGIEASVTNFKDIISLLNLKGTLVIKPVVGGQGRDVKILRRLIDGRIVINEEAVGKDDLKTLFLEQNDCIITQFIKQHVYSSDIFSATTNTIRIVTVIDPKTNLATVPYAVHRFGTKKTLPVDNVSRGGLAAIINVETGAMNTARPYNRTDGYTHHPDTNELIKGITVPHWNVVIHEIRSAAQRMPYLRLIGWDVVITNDGFYVIEVNRIPGFGILQLDGGIRNSDFACILSDYGVFKI